MMKQHNVYVNRMLLLTLIVYFFGQVAISVLYATAFGTPSTNQLIVISELSLLLIPAISCLKNNIDVTDCFCIRPIIMTSSKIDQKNIKEYVGLVRSHFTDAEMSNYEQQGRAAIIESIPQLGIIPTAQENAARVLVPLITQMGYREEDIIIQFRKEYGVRDIQSLINMDIENAKK